MEESTRYTAGIDVGTANVRAVLLGVNREGNASVIGYGELANAGMRRGMVANLSGPAEKIDRMLLEVERMSGEEIHSAALSINGSHLASVKGDGMITLLENHEISHEDLDRIIDSAIVGRVPANRDILDVIPLEYALDNQAGIRDPLGMTGSRLTMKACIVSALTPNCENLKKAAEMAKVTPEKLVPSVVAAGRAVLNEKQMESGVAVIDLGAATTSVAVFEEGDLQHISVVPMGSNNITNDLAIVLEIGTEIAEDIKRRFVTGELNSSDKDIVIKNGREELTFDRAEVNEIVRARLTEIFEAVRKELKQAHYDRRLPEGIVLVGGGAKMRDIEVFAKEKLEAAVKIGVPHDLTGVADAVSKPEFAAAVGLAMMAMAQSDTKPSKKTKKQNSGSGWWSKIFKSMKI